MGTIPKRESQRRRRNKPDVPVTRGRAGEDVVVPAADPRWHPIALLYYDAFQKSGQCQWWEPSDWVLMVDVLDELSMYKRAQKRAAHMRVAIDSVLARLLVSEGDRRRLRIELERGAQADVDEDASVAVLSEHVKRFSA